MKLTLSQLDQVDGSDGFTIQIGTPYPNSCPPPYPYPPYPVYWNYSPYPYGWYQNYPIDYTPGPILNNYHWNP